LTKQCPERLTRLKKLNAVLLENMSIWIIAKIVIILSEWMLSVKQYPADDKRRINMCTFVCKVGDYSINDLVQFTINTGTKVILRRYGKIENGKLTLFGVKLC